MRRIVPGCLSRMHSFSFHCISHGCSQTNYGCFYIKIDTISSYLRVWEAHLKMLIFQASRIGDRLTRHAIEIYTARHGRHTIPFLMIYINRIGGSVVECSPATRAAGVRFFFKFRYTYLSSDQLMYLIVLHYIHTYIHIHSNLPSTHQMMTSLKYA
jgi:hypothetical protein